MEIYLFDRIGIVRDQYKYIMHNIFSNFLCFTSFFVHLGALSNNVNDNVQNRISDN